MATQEETDARYMRMAIEEARAAMQADEIPIGAIIVANGQVIGRGHNMTETLGDVTAHAEMLAITAATQTINGKYLTGATIYVTVEPCLMCAGAIAWSQLTRIVYGTPDPKRGYTSYIAPPTKKENEKKEEKKEEGEEEKEKGENKEAEKKSKKGEEKRAMKGEKNKEKEKQQSPKSKEFVSGWSPVQSHPFHPFHPKATITDGVLAEECAALMRTFFRTKR